MRGKELEVKVREKGKVIQAICVLFLSWSCLTIFPRIDAIKCKLMWFEQDYLIN